MTQRGHSCDCFVVPLGPLDGRKGHGNVLLPSTEEAAHSDNEGIPCRERRDARCGSSQQRDLGRARQPRRDRLRPWAERQTTDRFHRPYLNFPIARARLRCPRSRHAGTEVRGRGVAHGPRSGLAGLTGSRRQRGSGGKTRIGSLWASCAPRRLVVLSLKVDAQGAPPSAISSPSSRRFGSTCEKCGGTGQYRLDRLIAKHGRDAKIPIGRPGFPLMSRKRQAASIGDRCAVHCPDLLRVFRVPME
jgi:hypothetical protein